MRGPINISRTEFLVRVFGREDYHRKELCHWVNCKMQTESSTQFHLSFPVITVLYIISLQITVYLNSLVRNSSEMETYVVSIERIDEYCHVESEVSWRSWFLVPWFCMRITFRVRGCPLLLTAWWRHQTETFSALLAICAGNSPVNSPQKGQWRGALMFSLICVWINGWVNNPEAGDLRRHRSHYDVIVMVWTSYNKCGLWLPRSESAIRSFIVFLWCALVWCFQDTLHMKRYLKTTRRAFAAQNYRSVWWEWWVCIAYPCFSERVNKAKIICTYLRSTYWNFAIILQYCDITWTSWRFKWPKTWSFLYNSLLSIQEIVKAPHCILGPCEGNPTVTGGLSSQRAGNVESVSMVWRYNKTWKSCFQAAWEVPETKPPAEWPEDGTVEFENYSTRYRPGLDLVLRNVTFSVASKEKVGDPLFCFLQAVFSRVWFIL